MELKNAIRDSSAFRRFKNAIRYHDLEREWYAYREQAFRKIAIDWCVEHGLEYTEEK